MDNQLVTFIEDGRYKFERAASRIDREQEPAARVFLVIKRSGIDNVFSSVVNVLIVETIACVVLACRTVNLSELWPTRAPRL